MKIKVNKSEYPLIILKDSQIKSRHTDLDIQELKIEITIYAELDMRAMDEILANRILTTLENGSPLKNFYITEHSYISNVNNSRKYFITLLESKFDVIKLNIDGVEFNPYFYEETNSKDGLFGYSKIKTDKKGFDYINQKKFSTDAISVIRLGISNEPIQVRIQSTREWSEINGEYKLIVAFNQL